MASKGSAAGSGGVGSGDPGYNEVDLGSSVTPLAPDHPYQPTTLPDVKRRARGPCPGPLEFVTSRDGALKLVQMLLSLVAFICVEAVDTCARCSAISFFEFVSCTAFLGALVLIIIMASSLHQRINIINWTLTDNVFTLFCTVFMFIASIVLAALNDGVGAAIAAVVFGFLALLAWGAGAALVALSWRRSPPWGGARGGGPAGGGSGQEYTRTRSESRAGDGSGKEPDDTLAV